jgi:adenylyltransferase/sulfurtransferase
LTSAERIRYRRQVALPEVGTAGQRALKGASVLVVGLGGLGTPAATYLAAAGVGKIGLVDSDTVDRPNLHRQFLYTDSDVGKNKASVAMPRLLRVNPNVDFRVFPFRLDSSNAMKIIREFDIVIDASDNLPSRYLVNDACVLSGKPDVYASVLRFDGLASVFCAADGPCYRCLRPLPPPPGSVEFCEGAGILGVVPGVMGVVQATQALSILLATGSPLIGRLLVFDGRSSSFEELRIKKDPGCPICGLRPTIRKLVDAPHSGATESVVDGC